MNIDDLMSASKIIEETNKGMDPEGFFEILVPHSVVSFMLYGKLRFSKFSKSNKNKRYEMKEVRPYGM